MALTGNSAVHLHVEKTPAGAHTFDVFLAITETNLETEVRGGENSGHRLRHVGVVATFRASATSTHAKPELTMPTRS